MDFRRSVRARAGGISFLRRSRRPADEPGGHGEGRDEEHSHRTDGGNHRPVDDRRSLLHRWGMLPGRTGAVLEHGWTPGRTRLHRHDRHLHLGMRALSGRTDAPDRPRSPLGMPSPVSIAHGRQFVGRFFGDFRGVQQTPAGCHRGLQGLSAASNTRQVPPCLAAIQLVDAARLNGAVRQPAARHGPLQALSNSEGGQDGRPACGARRRSCGPVRIASTWSFSR